MSGTQHARDSKFYGWASAVSETDQPLKVKAEIIPVLLSLPRYANMDIVDLCRMAEEKLTYTKASGTMSGSIAKGLPITDRAFAIAIIIGVYGLDNPMFQMPQNINLGIGEELEVSNG
jgi:hypothetical protein